MHARISRWWGGITLRTKITGVTVLLVTFGLVVAGFGTISVLRAYLIDEVDHKLTSSSTQFQARVVISTDTNGRLGCETTSGVIEAYYTALVSPDGDLLCDNRGPDDPVPDVSHLSLGGVTQVGSSAFTLGAVNGGGQWRAVATIVSPQQSNEYLIFVVGMSLNDTNSTITQFGTIFFFFGVNVVILGAALTRLLVTTTFAPLREVEDTAARFADGDFDQRMSTATPNTEVGRLNRSLNTMLSRIDAAFQDRAATIERMRRFIGDASHELRTPLVSVRGYAELYRMGALQTPEDVAQAMERIEKEALRMGELVEDLLELARLDEAKPLQLVPVDLVPIANDAALDTAAYAPERRVTVVVEPPLRLEPAPEPAQTTGGTATQTPAVSPKTLAGATMNRLRSLRGRHVPTPTAGAITVAPQATDAPATVLAEENKIRQVVTNLIANAIRFTPEGSPIELVVQVDEPRRVASIAIVDHGEGIPPQIRDRIFERFWRADTSRTRETGGTGLGLAIVAAIVKSHRGSVEVTETPGGGATFRVDLPLAAASPDRQGTPRQGTPRQGTPRQSSIAADAVTPAQHNTASPRSRA